MPPPWYKCLATALTCGVCAAGADRARQYDAYTVEPIVDHSSVNDHHRRHTLRKRKTTSTYNEHADAITPRAVGRLPSYVWDNLDHRSGSESPSGSMYYSTIM